MMTMTSTFGSRHPEPLYGVLTDLQRVGGPDGSSEVSEAL